MTQKIYIASGEESGGKSLMMLGMMDFLTQRVRKTFFFKPIIDSDEVQDPDINFVLNRYTPHLAYDSMYGCSAAMARELINCGKFDELLKIILNKFKELESKCDVILCKGTDYRYISPAMEFDLNISLANNLGCQILFVVNGRSANQQQVIYKTTTILDTLQERQCDILAMIVCRVAPAILAEVHESLHKIVKHTVPFYIVAESSILSKPTMGNLAQALKAEHVSGEDEWLHRQISNYKVAAMELPNFLDYIEPGSLIIVPGDRADIILASILSYPSTSYPRIAGILLTGGLRLADPVFRLIEGLGKFPVPILRVKTDTFTTAMNVSSLSGVLAADDQRKIAAALGILDASIDFHNLAKRIDMERKAKVTPIVFEHDLIDRARQSNCNIVLPEGTDERILRAAEIIYLRRVADLTLLGNEDEVRQKIRTFDLRLDDIRIVDPFEPEVRKRYADTFYELRKHKGITPEMAYDTIVDVSYFGTMMVHLDDACGMVSGAAHTTQHTIRPAFQVIKTKPDCSIVSSVFLMCMSDRVLVFGDCAVNPDPNPAQLADIAISSAVTAEMFGIEPRIAMMSYSTGASGKGKDVEKVRQAAEIAKKLRPDLLLEGPIQYDAAIDQGVAQSKMPDSKVAGRATVFIFPDLNTGNNTYKAVQRSANAVAIGPILQGLNKPVNDLSRGCTVTDIVNTIAITAIQAHGKGDVSDID